ncbi:OmpA family protein [uncultured Prevotella sp.]|uniref:OmpA family protein n=1 Tax=uncultured Prevotella sp. TaxID=159272 RepID=UPI0027E3A66C|nr:OmpA family protein [uncultured Prevotella sp.]
MKKLLIVLAMCGLTMGASAQETTTDPVQKYSVATNSFWSNWFIQVGADWNAYYSNEEHGQGLSHSPFKSFRAMPGFSVAVGKWFTPGLGLRTKFQGVWGRQVYDDVKHTRHMWTLNENVLFNLSNMLYGYNPERVWNFVPFLGGGINRNCSDNNYAMNLSFGILNTFRVSNKVGINFELGWNYAEEDFDGISAGKGSRIWEGKDNRLYAEVGLTFNLGKATWEKTPDVDAIKALSQSQIDALNAQLNDANAENARLKNLLAEKKNEAPASVKNYSNAPMSVFFNINKAKVASRKDLVNVKGLADYAKENNVNLVVTGYADSATGSAAYNQKLSERRAETVANELVKMGVSRDQITTEGKGGVKDLSPVSYNRRATVKIAD